MNNHETTLCICKTPKPFNKFSIVVPTGGGLNSLPNSTLELFKVVAPIPPGKKERDAKPLIRLSDIHLIK